jgi:SAM-dependent methyltransferase
MTEASDIDYAVYLRKRSAWAKWYREYWLYPQLSRILSGETLDVGCGIGDMLAFRKGSIGVDINQHNVDFCRQRGLDSRLMEVNRIPFEDELFDSLLLDNVLEHIANPEPLIRELRRVLRPGGMVLIGVPGRKGQASDPDHKMFYDETALERLAKCSGFRVVRNIYMPLWRSEWLSRHIRQYCIYSHWQIADTQASDS